MSLSGDEKKVVSVRTVLRLGALMEAHQWESGQGPRACAWHIQYAERFFRYWWRLGSTRVEQINMMLN